MNPAAIGGVPYRVPPEPSRVPSIVMAATVHAGLLLFLWAGISWLNRAPVSVEAEVWDLKTQQAAPPAPPEPVRPPAPVPVPKVIAPPVERPVAPKPPDIALERIKEQKQKQKLLDKQLAEEKLLKEKEKELADEKAKELADKKAKEKADKLAKAAADAAEKKKRDKEFDATVKRLAGQAGGGRDNQNAAPKIDLNYAAELSAKIKSAVKYAGEKDVPGNPRVQFKIDLLPTGDVIHVTKIKSSGIPAFDDAVERAINKSSPLPKKKDGTVDRSIEVGYKLKDFSDAD